MVGKPLIRCENVTKTLAGPSPFSVVKNASLEIGQGEFVIITGPSGSGKSSLLYLLGLLDRPSQGEVYIDSQPTSKLSEVAAAKMRLSHIGFVFQFHFLLPEFSALENVMLPMQRQGILSPQMMKDRSTEILMHLGLEEQLHKKPKQLSGGQSQRVAVARSLANDPTIILADEPTGNLDTKASATVQELLRSFVREGTRSVVVVTHDPDFARAGDRLVRIVDGEIESDVLQA